MSIRMLMSIGGLAPLPSDALVTPVTFRIHRRKLRGILEIFDAAEDGTRELSGEWVVGKKTWQRLQSEWRAGKSAKQKSSHPHTQPTIQRPKKQERVILYLHGGVSSSQFAKYHFLDRIIYRSILPFQCVNT